MVYQYYIFEVKRFANGELEHNVEWVFDEDPATARLKGESKWHEKLSAAALSETSTHAVMLIGTEGQTIKNECYYHNMTQDQIIDTPHVDIIEDAAVVSEGEQY